MALVALALPPLVILPLSAYLRPRLMHKRVSGLIRGLALTTTGLVIATSIDLLGSAGPEGKSGTAIWQLGLVGLGFAVSARARIHPALLVGVGAAVGLILAAQG